MKISLTNVALAVIGLNVATTGFCFDHAKCFKTETKFAMLRKYDFDHLGPWWITCRTSGKESSFKVSTESQMQGSTASIDPGVTVGHITSSGQFTSSWGDCDIQGSNMRVHQREEYIAENFNELKHDIAFGRGDHLNTLAYLSDCQGAQLLAKTLQKNYGTLSGVDNVTEKLSDKIDGLIRANAELNSSCLKALADANSVAAN